MDYVSWSNHTTPASRLCVHSAEGWRTSARLTSIFLKPFLFLLSSVRMSDSLDLHQIFCSLEVGVVSQLLISSSGVMLHQLIPYSCWASLLRSLLSAFSCLELAGEESAAFPCCDINPLKCYLQHVRLCTALLCLRTVLHDCGCVFGLTVTALMVLHE